MPKFFLLLIFLLQAFCGTQSSKTRTLAGAPSCQNPSLYQEYIGALFNNVTFFDLPINRKVQFHFLLSFAIDYDGGTASPISANGNFSIFWDAVNLRPSQVLSIKKIYPNVRVGLSIGGDSVGNQSAYFNPTSVVSWVSNAVSSLTRIIKEYNLDGIDIDYEHFNATSDTFAVCIGRLIETLKLKKVIKFASIAPFDNREVQEHYLNLWDKFGDLIDYVNFQFYAYSKDITVAQFLKYYDAQTRNYVGGKVMVGFLTEGRGGLSPENDFFKACSKLKAQNKLNGIFAWCADASKASKFKYEKRAQDLLAS